MTEWNEADHPRDEIGRFTYGNGGENGKSSKDEPYKENNNIQSREDLLYNNTKEKNKPGNITGGAASIVNDEISGVKIGEPMTIEDAIQGVNPNYDIFGNPTYKTNCQSCVAIFEARIRGYDVEVNAPYGGGIKDKLEKRPNIAYIDPATGKTPEFTKIKAQNEFDCINYLENTVQKGERYVFAFQWKNSINKNNAGHIITVTRDSNNKLKFYDPQNQYIYNNAEVLETIKYQFNWSEEPDPPKILRVDDKELNKEVLDQISKPARKSN